MSHKWLLIDINSTGKKINAYTYFFNWKVLLKSNYNQNKLLQIHHPDPRNPPRVARRQFDIYYGLNVRRVLYNCNTKNGFSVFHSDTTFWPPKPTPNGEATCARESRTWWTLCRWTPISTRWERQKSLSKTQSRLVDLMLRIADLNVCEKKRCAHFKMLNYVLRTKIPVKT